MSDRGSYKSNTGHPTVPVLPDVTSENCKARTHAATSPATPATSILTREGGARTWGGEGGGGEGGKEREGRVQ